MQELEHFKNWLHGDYWEKHFPEYIKRKYGAKAYREAIQLLAKYEEPLLIDKPK